MLHFIAIFLPNFSISYPGAFSIHSRYFIIHSSSTCNFLNERSKNSHDCTNRFIFYLLSIYFFNLYLDCRPLSSQPPTAVLPLPPSHLISREPVSILTHSGTSCLYRKRHILACSEGRKKFRWIENTHEEKLSCNSRGTAMGSK